MAMSASKESEDGPYKDTVMGFDLGHTEGDVILDASRFRYGSLSSQYGDFDVATVAQIEEAAMCCHLRDFQAALQIFDTLPAELSRHPAVVYEHSQVYWLDWSLYKCEKILEEGIAWAKEHTPEFGRPGVYTLLRIALGRTRVFTNGNYTEARDAMREVKAWLSKVPIEEYTDVQSYCASNYYLLLRFLTNVTNKFDAEYFRVIPAVAEPKGTTRLRHLREYLQSQGRLREARAILDQELGQTSDGMEQQKACKSLLEACSNQQNSQEPIWWISGRTKARLGQITTVGGQPEAGKEEFEGARQAMRTARALGKENNTLLLVRLAEIDASTNLGQGDVLNAYEEFVQSPFVQRDNYVHSTALTRASTTACELLESNTCSQNQVVFWKWYTKAESMLRQLGDIAYLSIFRPATAEIACSLFGDSGTILKWYEQFELQYPSLHLWRPKTAARRTMLLVYNRLKDEKQIFRTIAEMKDIADDQDNFWYENGFKKQEEISRLSSKGKADRALVPAAFQTEDPGIDWLLDWSRMMPVGFDTGWQKLGVNVGSDSIMPLTDVEGHLCLWIKQDFQEGTLTRRDLKDMLSFDSVESAEFTAVTETLDNCRIQKDEEDRNPKENIKPTTDNHQSNTMSTFDYQIISLTPASVSLKLFGTQNSPASDSQWERAFSTLSDWLLRKSTRPDSNRHYLLYNIQNQRLSYTIHSDTSYETRGLEAQRLIDLLPKLSVAVQQHISSDTPYWKNIIAKAKYMIYIESHGHVLLDMNCPELEEIIGLYNQSLAETRGNTRLIRQLHTNMDIAFVYFHAAAKLDPKAINGFFSAVDRAMQAFEKIRDGWRALTGWDKVQKLLFALEDKMILQIVPTTVAITCNFPDNQRELRDGIIWAMLQVAKSIGIGWLMESNAADARRDGKEAKDVRDRITNEANDSQGDGEKSDDSAASVSIQPNARQSSDKSSTSGNGQANAKNTVDEAGVQAGDQAGDQTRDQAQDQSESGIFTDQVQADLQAINRLGADAVFVDWYNSVSTMAKSPRPVIATLTGSDEKPKCCLADITWQQVDAIVERFMELETEELQDRKATKFLYKLNPLVEPLSWTKPGQTLVFSPCGNLHRIPLHALKIGKEIIIKRNPVVYCSSLSVLVFAFRMREPMERRGSTSITAYQPAAAVRTKSSTAKAHPRLKVSLFGDPPSKIGKEALETTAARFDAKANTGADFTAASFTDTIQTPNLDLLHYHGHAYFAPTAPTDHSLLFSDRALTLRDIFDIPPPLSHGGGFHVTLLGCGSGMSKTVPTNDVVGLVPSLLHAGASSTVSTLWKFSDADAATYSDCFYGAFAAGESPGGEDADNGNVVERVVDLARANQKAVLEIMGREKGLYHWGGFVLNGYWMMRLPGQGREKKSQEDVN